MKKTKQPPLSSYTISENKKTGMTIHLKGEVNVKTAPVLLKKLRRLLANKSLSPITIDLGGVSRFDDYGAFVLIELKHLAAGRNREFHIVNAGIRTKEILALVNFDSFEKFAPLKKKKHENIMVHLGDSTIEIGLGMRFLISFLGSMILSLIHVCRHPKSLRVNDTITLMKKTGVDALPIVAMISLLLGLVMAFMSSIQLKQFGANIYVASLVALAMVSELGPIMTAIVVAGRSGSAFAAEIGTMKIYEEIDALFAMGFDPVVFLVVPRVIAAMIMIPILTLFSNVFAIAGGLLVGVTMLDLTFVSYISQTMESLTLFEVGWGLTKSVVFALLIAWMGCLRGFQAKGGASAVGNAATSAVVSSIFLIILFDSVFAIARSYW